MLIKLKIIFLFFLSLLFSQEDGYDLYKNKNYDAAIQYYDNLINSNKKVPEADYGKGSSSYMQGDYDSALKSLDKALSTDQRDLKNKIYYNIGNNPGLLAPYQFGKADPIQELFTKLRDEGSKESYELAKKLYDYFHSDTVLGFKLVGVFVETKADFEIQDHITNTTI